MSNYKNVQRRIISHLSLIMTCAIVITTFTSLMANAISTEKLEAKNTNTKETMIVEPLNATKNKESIEELDTIIIEETKEETKETVSKEEVIVKDTPSNKKEETNKVTSSQPTTNSKVEENNSQDYTVDAVSYSERDVWLLQCAIYVEAGSNSISDRHKLGVANVILNRVAHPDYGNTIESVLTARGQYSYFSKIGRVDVPSRVYTSSVEAKAFEYCKGIAIRALNGERIFPSNTVYQAEFIQGTSIQEKIGNTYFCNK